MKRMIEKRIERMESLVQKRKWKKLISVLESMKVIQSESPEAISFSAYAKFEQHAKSGLLKSKNLVRNLLAKGNKYPNSRCIVRMRVCAISGTLTTFP